MMEAITLRETEISKGWMAANPELAVKHILKFFAECDGWSLKASQSKGFVTLTAERPE
jgi:hypothetical protein